jgi:hypothetical protein
MAQCPVQADRQKRRSAYTVTPWIRSIKVQNTGERFLFAGGFFAGRLRWKRDTPAMEVESE